MRLAFSAAGLLILAACSKPVADMKPDGAELYALNCAGCHDPGPGHPGTMLLEELGRPVGPLIGRKDLEADYVRSVVRTGLIEMPPFRPTELSEADLDLVIEHIRTAKPGTASPKK